MRDASLRASASCWRYSASAAWASSRAFSAESRSAVIATRRWSIICWIGPNAYFLRTIRTTTKVTSVQIISPVVGVISVES